MMTANSSINLHFVIFQDARQNRIANNDANDALKKVLVKGKCVFVTSMWNTPADKGKMESYEKLFTTHWKKTYCSDKLEPHIQRFDKSKDSALNISRRFGWI